MSCIFPAAEREKVLPLTVFFDGSCPLCLRKMDRFQRLSHSGELCFVDISVEGFLAGEYGLEQAEFEEQMHLRDAQGRWVLGVDALTMIWAVLPGWHYRWLSRVLSAPVINALARIGYRHIAANRHRLSMTSRR